MWTWVTSTRMSQLCILLELRVMEVVGATGTGAIGRAKLQVKPPVHHYQQTNNQLFTAERNIISTC